MVTLKQVSTIVAIAVGSLALGGGSWSVFEFTQEVAANTSWRLIQTFERLDLIRKKRRLTQVEWQKWCAAGRQLGVFQVCPRR